MYIKINWTFYLANVFLILSVSWGILDKYSKKSIRTYENKKAIEESEIIKKKKPNETFFSQ